MKRKYTKRNADYWNSLSNKESFGANTFAESYELSEGATNLSRVDQGEYLSGRYDLRFTNLKNGILPFEYSNGAVAMVEPIVLCQKAWANVAMVRNAVEAQVEFSTSKIRVKSKNKNAETVIRAWLNRINIANLAEQFFRERHRSGNVFLYRIDGNLGEKGKQSLKTLIDNDVKAAADTIPVKYLVLNPARIARLSTDWYQIVHEDDIKKYSYPQSDWEDITKKALDKNFGSGWRKTKLVPLEREKLHSFFYQKQDYETFSVPPLWAVLDDIELKMEFKKIDREVARTVENIILKVTHGTKPDDGGISPENHNALKAIFANPNIRRTLVADYTTDVEFIIPDIKKVLGKEKYEVVNEDIKEGLQFILVGDDKFSNMILKAKMFLAKLEKGQEQFLRFISGEVERVCKSLGLKNVPKIEFEKINLKDEVQLQRVLTRLYELGILTAEETLEAIKSGLLPDIEESIQSQKEFKKLREDEGLYMPSPMMFSQKNDAESLKEAGRPSGTTQPLDGDRETRVMGHDIGKIQEVLGGIDGLKMDVESAVKNKYKTENLNDAQIEFVNSLANSIITQCPQSDWLESLSGFMQSGDLIVNTEYIESVRETIDKFEVGELEAVTLVNSKI